MSAIVKLKKGLKLHFTSRNETEEIVKSSNNRETGMIQTFHPTKKMRKEYSVNFIMTWLETGSIRIQE